MIREICFAHRAQVVVPTAGEVLQIDGVPEGFNLWIMRGNKETTLRVGLKLESGDVVIMRQNCPSITSITYGPSPKKAKKK